jgi:hypothetical protein
MFTALSVSAALAQAPLRTPRIWNVTWRDISGTDGRTTRVPVLAWGESTPPVPGERYAAPTEIEAVIRLEDRLRQARAAQDVVTLEPILSQQFLETDVDGTSRDRASTIESIRGKPAAAVIPSFLQVRAADNAVIVSGEETGGTAESRRIVTHVYVRGVAGDWQLVSSTLVRFAR